MSAIPTATIWHNPSCGTSRNVLAALREAGIEPQIVLYLKTPPKRTEIAKAVKAAGVTVSDAVRKKNKLYEGLGLAGASDDTLLDALAANPELIERPFVFTAKGVRLCRPADRVKDILPG